MRHNADIGKMQVEMVQIWFLLSGRGMKQPMINSVQQILTECLCEEQTYHSKEKEEEGRVPDIKELCPKWMK